MPQPTTCQHSQTALLSGAELALHQTKDNGVIFRDHLISSLFLPSELAEADRFSDYHAVHLRYATAARARFIEEHFAASISCYAVSQMIILGAGFDTSAWRIWPGPVMFFEVDLPATQRIKRQRLGRAGIAIPSNCKFLEVDLLVDNLRLALAAAGWDSNIPTFFSASGLFPYLPHSCLESIFSFFSSVPRAHLVFDFLAPPSGQESQYAFDQLSQLCAQLGEPLVFHSSKEMDLLTQGSWQLLERLDPQQITQTYFKKLPLVFQAAGNSLHFVCVRRTS